MDVHDDPFREAASAVVGIASEFASVIMAVQSLQLRLIGLKPDKDAPLTPDSPEAAAGPTGEIDPRAGQAAARLAWEPALNEEWLANASPVETARVWAAALPFADHDASAADALERSEARLEEIHPEAMDHYRQLRAGGSDAADAMLASAPIFDTPSATAGIPDGPQLIPAHHADAQALGADPTHDMAVHDTISLGPAEHPILERPASASHEHGASSAASTAFGPTAHRGPSDLFAWPDESAPAAGLGADAPGPNPELPAPAPGLLDGLVPESVGQSAGSSAALPVDDLAPAETASRYLEYADKLAEAATTSAEPEALRAAESAMRNFPTANDAVERMPRPKPKASAPSPKKTLGKRLGR